LIAGPGFRACASRDFLVAATTADVTDHTVNEFRFGAKAASYNYTQR